MYNLNVNLAAAASNAVNSLLNADNPACNTPRTPEILNSLIAMSNPMDNYNFEAGDTKPNIGVSASTSSDSNSSSCSQLESPTSGTTPSVQHTCSQLIKAGLKLSIEQKRRLHSESDDLLDLDKCKKPRKNECSESEEDKHLSSGLTPEDEERRRRRRERNKIAATKCRLKKRERTANLVLESEALESQNTELKSQLQELEKERFNLSNMLNSHRPTCQKRIPKVTRDLVFNHRLPPVSVIEGGHFTRQTTDLTPPYTASQLEGYSRSSPANNHTPFTRFPKPPSIVVESPDYETHLTNLDDPVSTADYVNYNSQQCHNYNNSQPYTQGLDNGCMA